MSRDCACGLLVHDGKILLGLRAAYKSVAPNLWDTPGGGIKRGESIVRCLRRELREELGIRITRFLPFASISDAFGTYHIYVVTRWTGGAPAIQDDEHTDLRWFSVKEASALPNLADSRYPSLFARLFP